MLFSEEYNIYYIVIFLNVNHILFEFIWHKKRAINNWYISSNQIHRHKAMNPILYSKIIIEYLPENLGFAGVKTTWWVYLGHYQSQLI